MTLTKLVFNVAYHMSGLLHTKVEKVTTYWVSCACVAVP